MRTGAPARRLKSSACVTDTRHRRGELNRLAQIVMPNGEGTVGHTCDAAARLASIIHPIAAEASRPLERGKARKKITSHFPPADHNKVWHVFPPR
jgi:hypothetical protein